MIAVIEPQRGDMPRQIGRAPVQIGICHRAGVVAIGVLGAAFASVAFQERGKIGDQFCMKHERSLRQRGASGR